MASEEATDRDLADAPAPARGGSAPDRPDADTGLARGGIAAAGGATLVRASQLTGRPVVTLGGDRDVEVKDVVFDKQAGGLTGFTLRKPGLLGGPQSHVLRIADVTAIGPDAVMIPSHSVFTGADVLAGSGEDVLGDQVITDDGVALGTVFDVIARVQQGEADVVGFEVESGGATAAEGEHIFVPLPAALAISGEAIVVPAAAKDHITEDYVDFSGSVDAFRNQIEANVTTNLSELTGRSVLDVSNATTVGKIIHGILDPDRGSVVALHLAKTPGAGTVLPWESIRAIGPDAVTIDSAELIRAPTGRAEHRAIDGKLDPIGNLVLTDQGSELGTVTEVRVDERTGTVEQLVSTGGPLDGSRLVGQGGYAVVVTASER